MKTNNYTRAPEGVPSIEHFCGYDTFLSQIYFKDNFERIRDIGRYSSLWYYTDNGQLPAYDSGFKVIGTRSQKVKFLTIERFEDNYDEWSDGELDEVILEYLDFTERDYENAVPKGYFLRIKPVKDYEIVSIRGYSQGDYAEVIYSPSDIAALWGKEPSESELREMFENLFFDSPIYATFTIDGEEFNYYEMPEFKSEYEWDRDAWIGYVADQSGVSPETLEDFVPAYPEYN